jgi:hypothetical protein
VRRTLAIRIFILPLRKNTINTFFKMVDKLGPEEFITLWDGTIDKLVRYHDNISIELQQLIVTIKSTMDGDGTKLVPAAEGKAAFGKKLKADIRAMWTLEYEIEQLQEDFSKQMGSIDVKALTDDFIEDMLLQSKPLQGILGAIRTKQRVKLADIKKEYDAAIEPLEPLYIKRPPKPAAPAPAAPAPAAVEAPAPAAVTA